MGQAAVVTAVKPCEQLRGGEGEGEGCKAEQKQ